MAWTNLRHYYEPISKYDHCVKYSICTMFDNNMHKTSHEDNRSSNHLWNAWVTQFVFYLKSNHLTGGNQCNLVFNATYVVWLTYKVIFWIIYYI